MLTSLRRLADDTIVDRAAGLFARRGFAKTSVQDVADAVGLSKAGLLHHYPSKDALHEAVLGHATELGRRVGSQVEHLPPGISRDLHAVEVLVDVALAHPGLVALLLAPATQDTADVGAAILAVFGVHPDTADPERCIRVLGALGALAVLTLAAHEADDVTTWRPQIVAVCTDALGHRDPGHRAPGHRDPGNGRPGASVTHQLEA